MSRRKGFWWYHFWCIADSHSYLGSLTSTDDKDYLTALSSILANEARHTSYLRASLAEAPFPSPYDTPLDFVRSILS